MCTSAMPEKQFIGSRCLGLQMESNTMISANKVRRCLFGMPDHEELKQNLKSQLKNPDSELRFMELWNFDLQLDKPCRDGRFEWTIVSDEYIPSFYTKNYKRTKFSSVSSRTQVATVPDALLSRLSETVALDTDSEAEAREIQRENETTPEVRTRQTHIDDFMKKVKKRKLCDTFSSSSEDEGSLPTKTTRLNVDA